MKTYDLYLELHFLFDLQMKADFKIPVRIGRKGSSSLINLIIVMITCVSIITPNSMLYSCLSVEGKMHRYLNFEVFYYMHLLTVDIKTY